jgi:hypothetical protein
MSLCLDRFSEHADAILKTVLANTEKQAKPCSGCYKIDMDDPEACISVHVDVSEGRRDHDRRIDWQGEPMLGRLPYDRYGLLQVVPGKTNYMNLQSTGEIV